MKDVTVARKYISKESNARTLGIEFTLSFVAFKNLMRAKKCYFTGLPLTADTITVDRVDNTKGYVSGNVRACHKLFNNLKGGLENPTNKLNLDNVLRGLQRWKLLEK